jgi:putative phosphoribosyl transferase
VRALRPARLVLAVPVAAPDALAALRPLADEIACVETPASLGAVGAFYLDFPQLEDGEVTAILDRAAARPQRSGGNA